MTGEGGAATFPVGPLGLALSAGFWVPVIRTTLTPAKGLLQTYKLGSGFRTKIAFLIPQGSKITTTLVRGNVPKELKVSEKVDNRK